MKRIIPVVLILLLIISGCASGTTGAGSDETVDGTIKVAMSTMEMEATPVPTPIHTPKPSPTPLPTPIPTPIPPMEKDGMVNIAVAAPDIFIELRYASANNFTGKVVYPIEVCLLSKDTAEKLIAAQAIFKQDGYAIKIWDAYRPARYQQVLYDATENKTFLMDPKKGSKHSRGAAVDLTLVDSNGNELEMPTDFDDFTTQAARDDTTMTETARKNLDYLTQVMIQCGFQYVRNEWWHYEDVNYAQYPITDLDFELFLGGVQ